jgi:YD repeat-containing protein
VQSAEFGVRASDGLYWLDLDSVPQVTGRTIVGSNLLVNGSFGQTGAYVVTATGRSSATMVGWTKANPETFEQVASGQMGVTTHDGGFWLDMESIPTTGPVAVGSNLLVNGGFETSGTFVQVASGRANSTLPGWNKTNAEAFEQVETDATDIDGPIEGVYMLDLDSVPIPAGLVEGPNLIVNGSFEQSAASYTVTGTGRYNDPTLDIPGWTRLNAQGFEQINSGVGGVTATDGAFFLDMEANGDAESRMDIAQTISGLPAGQQLSLKFDYANTAGMVFDVETFENSGSLEVYWNGALVGRVSSHDTTMATKGFTVTSVEGDNILRFREVGVTDGQGVYLDNVRLNTTVTPPNLIINGSFEESAELWAENINGRINEGNIPGWVKANNGMFEQISSGNLGVSASDGNFYLDMEGGGADSRMDISQTIRGLAPGKALTLKFDFANTAPTNSGVLEVYWNNALIATISSQETVMTTKTFSVTSKGGDNKLRFRETGVQDSRGVSIDNVRLYENPPATVGGNMDIYQTVPNLTAGQVMQLQFNHARMTSTSSASFEVWWNQTLVATIADGKKWMQTNSYFVTAAQGDNVLRFKGTGTVDGLGAVIDDVRLFATNAPPHGGNMDISQTVANLAAGQIMQLQFDHANRTTSASGSFEVWWNNNLVETITSTGTAMQTKTYSLVAVAGNNTVRFKSLGTVDAAGASLDNVRLFHTEPVTTGGNMKISQVIPNLAAGQTLQLQFDHANRTTSSSGSFEVLWNGAVVATITSTGTTMQSKTYVVTAVAGSNTLEFRGLGEAEGAGASIDNVRLFKARPVQTGGNMAIAQVVPNLAAGQVLQLQFDHANRTGGESGGFQVLWNGAVIATVDSPGAAMQSKTYFVTAVAGDNRLEFRGIGTVDADGASIDNVRLFATQADLSGGNMIIAQDVPDLAAGQILELKFNHANRTTSASGSFEVVWNGSVVATIDGSDPVMQTKAYFVTAVAGTNRLEFRGLGTVDGEGASLDNVWLRATELKSSGTALGSGDSSDSVTRFYYDRLGRATLSRDAEDYLTETAYNAFGEVTSVTRRAARTTSPVDSVPTAAPSAKDALTQFEYDQLGRLRKVVDAENQSEVYELDAFGRRTAYVNKLGGRTTFEYDNRGLLTSETLPITSKRSDGLAVPVVNKFEYDKRGNTIKSIEAFGLPEERTTIFQYDKLDRLTKTEGMAVTVLDQIGHVAESSIKPTQTVQYDDAGNVIAMTDALGARTLFYYDRANRKKSELGAAGLLSTFGYDGNGNLINRKSYANPVAQPLNAGGPEPVAPAGEFRETIFEYDKLNRLTKTRVPNVRTGAWNGTSYVLATGDLMSTLEYDSQGNVIKSTDANGAVTYTYYDRLGRATAQVDPENYLISWERDAEGNALSERRAAQRAAWTPTTKAPPTLPTHVDDRVTSFSYDRNGRRRFESRANVLSFTVDANGLAVESTSKVATIEYRYNGLGLVTHKIEATGDAVVYDYDLEGRLVTETHQGYTDQADILVKPKVSYSYNGLNLLTQTRQGGETEAPGDRITLNEYVAGRLASTTDPTGAKYSYAYDAAGNLLRETYMRQRVDAPSVEEAILYERDRFGRVTSRTVAAKSGSTWAKGDSQDISYNLFGEVSQRGTNKKGQEQYSYDRAGRLMSTNSGDGVWRFFVQDRNGNQTLAIESEGMDLAGKSIDEVLTIAKGGSASVGGTYAADINVSFTVYDQRGSAIETRLPHRELNATDARVEFVLWRDFNAFGEVSAERDAKGALTTYVYNTMGRTVSISRPIVASTNEAGFDIEAQPVETLYFDLSGRLVGSRDPNGNAVTRHLLAGTGYGGTEALTITEFHADGGRLQNRYDVFGDLRVTINEVNRTARMAYDARGRLVRLEKAGGLVEQFVYDLLGQRIKHWNSVLLESDSEITEYDMQGRIRSQRAFGGEVTTTSYQWAPDMVTDGMGTFGGWIETTTYANSRQKIEHSDVFGRAVQKTDLGGHLFTMKYDKAARLVEQRGGETMTYAYLNSGMVGSVTTSRRNFSGFMEPWVATYGYDQNGNKIREQLTQNGALVQDASAEYDALNRLTLWAEAGTAATPHSRVAYKYDANSNIRMIHADYAGLDGFGNMTGTRTKEHWYRFDAMNRVVVSKGVRGNNGIVAGPEGVEIGYDQAGQRVRTLRSEQRMGTVYAPPPWDVDVSMPYTHEIVETYKYDDAGHLDQVFGSETTLSWEFGFSANPPVEPGILKADYDYDALGRLRSQKDFRDGNDVVYERTVTSYTSGGQIFTEFSVSKQLAPNPQNGAREWTTFRTETKYYYGGETQTAEERQNEGAIGPNALGGVVKAINKNLRNGALTHWSVIDTAYDWWDGAVQAVVNNRADLWDPTKDGHSLFAYNAWGQLEKVNINDGRRREVRFTNNLAGEAIRRDEQDSNGAGDPHEVWHRFNGRQMGYVGNNGTLNIDYQSSINARTHYVGPSQGAFRLGDGNPTPHADFDQNYSAINSFEQGSTGGTYTVRAGDTLSSIAAQLWGDSSLWYKLAEANGLSSGSGLADGQRLTIPVGVFKTHHNASTFMPFDPGAVVGDLSPTAPRPQAPAQQKKNKCGVFGQILLIVVAVAVTFLTQGALAGPMTGLLNSTLAGNIAAGAIAGAAGSVASQAVGVLTGIQERFDWKGVAMAGISGAVGGAMGGFNAFGKTGLGKFTDLANDIVRAAGASAITQGIGVATRLQGKFSWAGVASAGVAAGVAGALGRHFELESVEENGSWTNRGRHFLVATAGTVAGAAAESLISGRSFGDTLVSALPGLIGTTVGEMLGEYIQTSLERRSAETVSTPIIEIASNGFVPQQDGKIVPIPCSETSTTCEEIPNLKDPSNRLHALWVQTEAELKEKYPGKPITDSMIIKEIERQRDLNVKIGKDNSSEFVIGPSGPEATYQILKAGAEVLISAVEWFGEFKDNYDEGFWKGEWTDNPTWAAFFGRIVSGVTPIGDLRDFAHDIYKLWQGERTWWDYGSALLGAIGFIPGAGDAIKNIGRPILKWLRRVVDGGGTILRRADELPEQLLRQGDDAAQPAARQLTEAENLARIRSLPLDEAIEGFARNGPDVDAYADRLAELFTKPHKQADRIVLGPNPEYIDVAKASGGIVLDTGDDAYRKLKGALSGLSEPEMNERFWKINRAFLERGMAQGLPIDFTPGTIAKIRSNKSSFTAMEMTHVRSRMEHYGYTQNGLSFRKKK